ncbi:MAG: protein kinase [Acidobacteriota bacterium]
MDGDKQSRPSDFKVGDWWVRPDRNVVERVDEIEQVESRSMAVLICLASHAPAVVKKDRLFDEAWSGNAVSDSALSHAIWDLRRAFGDTEGKRDYIRNKPGVGYQLIARVQRPQGSPEPLEGEKIDEFLLGEELGRGSMGIVFRATDLRLDRPVAIKFIAPKHIQDPEAVHRFDREARILASLDHPNIATIHGTGETRGGYRYLVGSLYEGGSIKDRLVDAGTFDQRSAIELTRQLLAGLSAAHQRDIVHRDIKPANLLLDNHGTLKICDFGIAKPLDGTDLTQTGKHIGTQAYSSPEQSLGNPVDHRTDLWSAGLVFYELLTGRRDDPSSLDPDLSKPIRRFIAKALAAHPNDRFQNADEMIDALDEINRREVPKKVWLAAAIALTTAAAWLLSGAPAPQLGEGTSTNQAQIEPTIVASSSVGDTLHTARRLWLQGNHPSNLDHVERLFGETVVQEPGSVTAREQFAIFLAEKAPLFKNEEIRKRLHERARTHISFVLDRDSTSWASLAAQARIALTEGDSSSAERLARRAIEARYDCGPDSLCDIPYLVLGNALWNLGKREQAFLALENGLRVGAGRVRCQLAIGQLRSYSSESEEAKLAYKKVLAIDPGQSTALLDLSSLYLFDENYKRAAEYLDQHYRATLDPKSLNNLGYAQFMEGLFSEAAKTFEKAIVEYRRAGLSPLAPLIGLGDTYLENGREIEARHYFISAIAEIDQNLAGSANQDSTRLAARAMRAMCLAKAGKVGEGVTAIEELLSPPEQVEQFPDLIFYGGMVYALAGNRTELFKLARQWMELGRPASYFLDDPAFNAYETDLDYLRIVAPGLVPEN